MPKQRLVRFDWAMKRLLRNKANFDILEGFLSELLEQDIKILQLLESETNQENRLNKQNRVDLLAENHQKELLLIEVQNESEHDYFQRMLFGVSKTLTEHLEAGQSYGQIKKIYSISIVYFDLGQGKDYIYVGKTDFLGKHQGDKLLLSETQKEMFGKEDISQIFPEYYLIKVNNFDNIAKDTLDEWIYFLKNEEIKSDFRAKGIQKAKQEFDIMDMSSEERKAYNAYLDDLHYLASMLQYSDFGIGFQKGQAQERKKAEAEKEAIRIQAILEKEALKKQAEEEKEILRKQSEAEKNAALNEQAFQLKLEIAKKCLQNGMSLEQAALLSGLTSQEIEKL